MQIIKDESGRVLTFVGNMDIRAVHHIRASIQSSFETANNLVCDLAQVTACDTAALQLLYSARQTAERMGGSVQFTGLSDVVLETSSVLDISFQTGPKEGGKQDAA